MAYNRPTQIGQRWARNALLTSARKTSKLTVSARPGFTPLGGASFLFTFWMAARYSTVLASMNLPGDTPEAAAGVLSAPGLVLTSALEYLDREHGDTGRYLSGPGGTPPADLRRLSDQLLTP